MATAIAGRHPLDAVAEDFVARYRRGERPSPSEYAQRFPELAEQISEVLRALQLVEDLAPGRRSPGLTLATPGGSAPDHLGEYRLIREIGRGGMGVVYEAVQESLGRHVALKVLPFQAAAPAAALERFRREARAAAQLEHPNIVPVYGLGEAGGVHFYAMQYVVGQGLDQVLNDVRRLRASQGAPTPPLDGSSATLSLVGPTEAGFDPRQRYFRNVASLGIQVADALACAHAHGVLHRDVKPSNLLLDAAGKAWVTDFGLAKQIDLGNDDPGASGAATLPGQLTHTGDLVGTLRYMSPERLSGWVDPRSDVYGLGLTLYELLTLEQAFTETDQVRLLRQITSQEPRAPRQHDPRIPPELETIVLKATAKEPRERYASAMALGEDLRCYLEGRPIGARRTSQWDLFWRWCRRYPALATACGSTAAALVLGLLLFGWQWLRAEELAEQAGQQATVAKQQAERANESNAWALGAVKQLLDEMHEATHAVEAPELHQTHLRLSEKGVMIQEDLIRRGETDLRPMPERIAAWVQLANLRRDAKNLVGAEAAFRQALELIRQLPAAEQSQCYDQRLIATREYAKLCAADRWSLAAESFTELFEALNRSPERDSGRFFEGQAYSDYANLLWMRGRADEADRYFAKAEEALVAALPVLEAGNAHLECQCRFIAGQNNVQWAALLYRQQRPAEELACYERAVEHARHLLAKKPADPLFRKLLVHAYQGVGDGRRRRGEWAPAEQAYAESARHGAWLVQRHAHESDFHVLHARGLNNAAVVQAAQKRLHRAVDLAHQAARHAAQAVCQNPAAALNQRSWRTTARTLLDYAGKLGDSLTLAEAARLVADGPDSEAGETLFLAATSHALAAQLARAAPERSLQYETLALIELQRAAQGGFTDAQRLETAEAFAPLRQRHEYQQVLNQLKNNSSKGQPDGKR